MFSNWGQFIYRWRWFALVLSLSIFVFSPLIILTQGIKLVDNNTHINSNSEQANNLISSELPKDHGSSFSLIFSSTTLHATDPAFQQSLEKAITPLLSDPRVKSVDTPYNMPGSSLTSTDQRDVLVNVNLVDDSTVSSNYYAELRNEVKSDQLNIVATNGIAISHDFNTLLESSLQKAETVSLPLVLILLLLVFGAVVAGLIPLMVGVVTIITALAGVYLLSHHFDTSQYTINIITLIGLGISIDYSLFIVSRFKDELRQATGPNRVKEAIGRAMQTAGKTITFSGLAVAIGLAGMLFYQGSFLSSMGLAGSIVVVAALFYSLTFLPAVLSLLGDRVNSWRIPIPKNDWQVRFWRNLSRFVMTYPLVVLVPVTAILLIVAGPALTMRISNADITALPPSAESRQGFDILKKDFANQTQTSIPVVIHFLSGQPLSKDNIDYLFDLNAKLSQIPKVTSVNGPFSLDPSFTKQSYENLYSLPDVNLPPAVVAVKNKTVGRDFVLLSVQSNTDATSDEARNIVTSIRSLNPPSGGELLVTGRTAFDIDFLNFIFQKSIYAFIFIVLATIVIIFIMLRSVVLPFKAVLMNLLSISASFGLLVFIFQQGHLANLLNFTPQPLDPSIPVILFCIVFGLSMDYEVLLLSRMKEEYERLHNNKQAVANGLEKSAILITGAGLIMVAVFAAFGLADVVIIKAIGLGMAIAVFIDMTLVRGLVVPSLMRILGDLNWWAPKFLRSKS